VAFWKSIFFDDWEEPPDGCRVGDIRHSPLQSTASEEATVAAATIDNDGPRISGCGEDLRVVTIREYRPFERCVGGLVGEILSGVGEDPGSSSDSDASCKATLYDIQARFAIMVDHVRIAHQIFRDDSLKWEEAIAGILETWLSVGSRVHLAYKLVSRNPSSWIEWAVGQTNFSETDYQNVPRSRKLPLKDFVNLSLSSSTTA